MFQQENITPFDVNKEITRSFQSTNYSQWERQKPVNTKPKKNGNSYFFQFIQIENLLKS